MAKIKARLNGTKKDAIIQSAAALFRSKGFKASSMRELAEAIGVEAPSLYNHIGSKSELLEAICFKIAADFTLNLEAIEQSKESSVHKIEQLIRFHIQIMLQEYDELYVANYEWKHLGEPALGSFLNQRKTYEKRMMQLIKEGIAKGELKAIHPNVAVLTILSAVRGIEFWQRHKSSISATELEENMVDHLLNGLTK
ncbi:MAG: TetR/AcrR family transcriptional regulator [Chitinophagaceae bacterium]|nr:MAG: TetR/AcrR family transcriptional regulator [Chitinophagaceae bacterium]